MQVSLRAWSGRSEVGRERREGGRARRGNAVNASFFFWRNCLPCSLISMSPRVASLFAGFPFSLLRDLRCLLLPVMAVEWGTTQRESEQTASKGQQSRHCRRRDFSFFFSLAPRFALNSFFFLFSTLSLHNQAYEELGKLGEGTYGTVLRCRHRGTKELVAVKRFKESGEENQVSFAFVFFLWRQAGEREG